MKFLKLIKSEQEAVKKPYEVLYYNETTSSVTFVSNKVTITFKDWNDAVIATQKYTVGETVVYPEFSGLERAGYRYIGWNATIETATNDTNVFAMYELIPVITFTMNGPYTDTASIACNATHNTTVADGTLSFSTDLASNVATLVDNVLTFKKHYEGSVTVTATAKDIHGAEVRATKEITVSCDGADTVECVISDVSTPEVKAKATSATITYNCNVTTTTHAGVSSTVVANKEQVVTFEANKSEEARDIVSSFTCEHGEVVNYTVKQKAKPTPTYEAVDLGLPSGLKWSSCNVGATDETEYGLYFQWGDTVGYEGDEAKAHSRWETAPFNNGSSEYDETYFASVSGTVCPNGVLASQYDAAHVHMGGNWRMPTTTETAELNSNTNKTWVIDFDGSGVNGWKFTNKTDSTKYIFIPASGLFNKGSFDFTGYDGYYWTSCIHPTARYAAYYLLFNNRNVYSQDGNHRFHGRSVRGVQE